MANVDAESEVDEGVDSEALEEIDAPDAASMAQEGSGFPKITKRYEEEGQGHKAFEDAAYYKSLMSGGSEQAKRLHAVFQKYTGAKDPKDKTVYRQQIVSVFWEFFGQVARGSARPDRLSAPQKYLLRFGVLHPGLLTADIKALLARVVDKNELAQPVHYLDEWFGMIGREEIRPSTTDEAPVARANTSAHLSALLEKANGKLDGAKGILRSKNQERSSLEKQLAGFTARLCENSGPGPFAEVSACYSESQKQDAASIHDAVRNLLKIDREMENLFKDYEEERETVETLLRKIEEAGGAEAVSDTASIDTEMGTVRQLAKMTVGRQGNAFPICSGEFFHCLPNGLGTRENVLSVLSWIESVDAEVFLRVYKGKPSRVPPYVILVPSYGDNGWCWEPFDRSNKITGRGRITVPMYPRNITAAVLTAIADYRWQVAKEKASYMWMEEGVSGAYYQWFQAQKLKGDVRMYFIQDYITWLTKESEGTQKLDKELRGIMWRHVPFTQPVKDKLKDRNLIYQELYQRDLNRAKSDL